MRTTIMRALGWGLIVTVICRFGVLGQAAFAEVPVSFPPATPESQGVLAAAVRRLSDEVARYVKEGTIVGGELLIIKNRKTILHDVYGDRDRQDKQPMEHNTIFNVRSMTKPFTCVAIQILVDEGKIKLSDPVAKYLPGFDNDKSRAITIEQLLEHRSGLPLTVIVFLNGFKDLQAQAEAAGKKGPRDRLFPGRGAAWAVSAAAAPVPGSAPARVCPGPCRPGTAACLKNPSGLAIKNSRTPERRSAFVVESSGLDSLFPRLSGAALEKALLAGPLPAPYWLLQECLVRCCAGQSSSSAPLPANKHAGSEPATETLHRDQVW